MFYQPTSTEVRQKRESLKLSQQEAATLCLVQANTWSRWEQGKRAMPAAVWELLQYKALEITHSIGIDPVSTHQTNEVRAMLDSWEE